MYDFCTEDSTFGFTIVFRVFRSYKCVLYVENVPFMCIFCATEFTNVYRRVAQQLSYT